jgi:hypothetical protein
VPADSLTVEVTTPLKPEKISFLKINPSEMTHLQLKDIRLLLSRSFMVAFTNGVGTQYSPYLRTSSMTRQYCSKLTVGGTEWSLW